MPHQLTLHHFSRINIKILIQLAAIVALFAWIFTCPAKPLTSGAAASVAPALQPPGPEIIERRTAYSKHFSRGDGKYQAWITTVPMHVRDAQGSWQDITAARAPQGSVDLKYLFADTYIETIFPSADNGGAKQAWIGSLEMSGGIYRALYYFNLTPTGVLPDYASIDGGASDVKIQLFLDDYYGSPATTLIGIYSSSTYWNDDADWLHSTGNFLWNTPGGDYDTLMALASVDSTLGYKSWYSLLLRDDVALERSFATQPFGLYGFQTNGYLFKNSQETGDHIKYFSTSEEDDISQRPVMIINYSDPTLLAHRTPITRRVPSPDFFITPSSSLWSVVGLRVANTNARYFIHVFDDPAYGEYDVSASSTELEPVNFVVITPEAPDLSYYPRTIPYGSQTGNYQIEFVQRLAHLGAIDPGESYGPYSIEPGNLFSLYTFDGVFNQAGCLMLTPTGGDARLGMAVFQPGGTEYLHLQGRSLAIAEAMAGSAGQAIAVNYHMTSVGVFGLVIWNQSSTTTTTFTLKACTPLYLPLLRR